MPFIYSLHCPETRKPRYVGKCTNVKQRLAAHIAKAKGGHTNHHCAHWIRTLLDRGLRPTIHIVEEIPAGGDWQSAEAAAIKRFRDEGHDLTNLTGGGDGFADLPKDVLLRRGKSRSKWLADPVNKAKHLATCGASHSRPDAKENHSAGAKSAWADPVKREKMLAGMRTPEALARRSEASKRRQADPEFAARHREIMKRISSEPEGRERMRKARDIRWSQKAEA